MNSKSVDETAKEQARYQGVARWYDLATRPMELLGFRRLRRRLWQQVDGARVLEIGVGTGVNLSLYPDGSRVVAIDIAPAMLQRAVERARRDSRRVDFLLADAQHLPLKDAVFDTVIATCVFCSVPDPQAGLREALRVCAPGGKLRLFEHVIAKNRLLGRVMRWLNPIAVRIGGENIDRDTVGNVRAAGWTLEREESRMLGILKLIYGRPQP
ncbi:MAG: methyltransferase domain-containing protein [Dehalococcoidia bacterium]|nr:methyltransferase domain-containing protein [Dehalococcoidia bacterium]